MLRFSEGSYQSRVISIDLKESNETDLLIVNSSYT